MQMNMETASRTPSSSKPSSATRNVVELKPLESLNWLYHLHYVRSEFEICQKQIDRSERKSEYALYLKGLIKLRNDGDVRGALEAFSEIKSLNNPTYIKAIARCFVLLGRHSNVCDLVRESALVLTPSDWQLWHMLGIAYFHLGNIPLAKDAFQHALQTTNRTDPFLFLSQCHLVEGDSKSAVFVLRRASELSPEDTNLTTKLGILQLNNGMASKGIDKIMQLQHVSANTTGDLAMALAVGAVIQDVKLDYEGALYRYKMANIFESPCLWNNIALNFAHRKRFVAAVSCYKRALYLNPFDWRANYNMGLLNLQLHQFASGFHYFKTAATMSNGMANIFSLLAICLQKMDDDLNARQAHLTATKSSLATHTPGPVLNYAIFLFNKDSEQFKDVITELLMEFEQCWLKRKQNSTDFDVEVMRTATKLAQIMNLSSHMSWIKVDQPAQPLASVPALTSSIGSNGSSVPPAELPVADKEEPADEKADEQTQLLS